VLCAGLEAVWDHGGWIHSPSLRSSLFARHLPVASAAAVMRSLSLAPLHRRRWGSVYAALRNAEVAAEALRNLLARQSAFAGPLTFAVVVSIWPRPDAETSPERGYRYAPAATGQQRVVGG